MASAAEASASGVYGLHSASVQLFSGGIIAACPHNIDTAGQAHFPVRRGALHHQTAPVR